MTTGIIHDQNLEKHIEKQMGCMAGFFQIFDRHHLLTGKRLNSTKRLPPPPAGDSTPGISSEFEKPQKTRPMTSPSPDRSKSSPAIESQSPADISSTLPLPLQIFECKEGTNKSSRKFCKEAPRLSFDSRASVDGKGQIRINPTVLNDAAVATSDGVVDDKRRSPSVIAKLMGLERLPNSTPDEPTNNAELRRSASESRVSRDLYNQYRFIDGANFQLKQPIRDNAVRENTTAAATLNGRGLDPVNSESPKPLYRGVWKSQQQRKSFFDTADIFPEPKQSVCGYGDIEKRLKMRGIDEPSKDLETLKQILEAMQLKGLLHSKKASSEQQITHRNFVYDRSTRSFTSDDQSPIVIMKPSRSPVSNRRLGNDSPRRNPNNSGENLPSMSPRRERHSIESRSRSSSSLSYRESNNVKSPSSSPVRRRALSVEEQRRASPPVHSPRPSPKRNGTDHQTITTRLPRNRRSTAEIAPKEKVASVLVEDESSSFSESSVSTSSHTDTERLKTGESKGGRSLLERCDKLLNSILEMTATELQPSPVSVLDSSFYKDESSSSPSPVPKRSIDFKDQSGEFEEEIWSPAISPLRSKHEDESDDCDFVYISDILRAFNYLPEDSDIFLLLEKQQYAKGKDTSKASRLQRRLIFDIITEILHRNRQLPPWQVISLSNSSIERPLLRPVWSEFQRIRERETAEDLFEIICSVLRKDLAGDGANRWGDFPVEMAESVLDIERLIFKDLVGETIRDLAVFAGSRRVPVAPPRRKLVF